MSGQNTWKEKRTENKGDIFSIENIVQKMPILVRDIINLFEISKNRQHEIDHLIKTMHTPIWPGFHQLYINQRRKS